MKVPEVDQVPFVVLTVDKAAKVPLTTGNTELVTFEAGTITVAAVLAVVLNVDPLVKLPKTWART